MRNLLNYIEVNEELACAKQGKMPKQGGAIFPRLKRLSASQRLLNLKSGSHNTMLNRFMVPVVMVAGGVNTKTSYELLKTKKYSNV